jgi:hypothetical protein
VKTGSIDFVGQFLYAISQGQMVSSPVKHYAWVGTNNIKFLADTASITLTHYYSSAATMEATPNACPITSGKIFCDLNSYSYLQPLFGTSGYTERTSDYSQFYNVVSVITRGTGDTSNSVITIPNASLGVYDNKTGNDVTSTYWSYLGINPASSIYNNQCSYWRRWRHNWRLCRWHHSTIPNYRLDSTRSKLFHKLWRHWPGYLCIWKWHSQQSSQSSQSS